MGVGHLGQAITNHILNYKFGFSIVGLFDVNPTIVGLAINGVKVQNSSELEDYVRSNNIDIGIICCGKDNAQEVADTLVRGGVEGIPERMAIENVHLSESLHTLSFLISSKEKENR